jgi:hypothetical protein
MTTPDHFWTQRLPGNCLSIRGDVCGFEMATGDVHFSPRAIAGPENFFRGANPPRIPSGKTGGLMNLDRTPKENHEC